MPVLRKRDTVLAGVELIRRARTDCNVSHILAFLYICENEGLNVSELADLMETTSATASRTASALEAADEQGEGLIRSGAGSRHKHSRVIRLSPRGAELRARLDGLIREARPIAIGTTDSTGS